MAQCLAVDIDVSSTATSEQVTISSVELDGQTHSLAQPGGVSITQKAVHTIPLHYAETYRTSRPTGTARADAVPWLPDGVGLYNMIGSDSEDPVDLYRTYNHTVRSALSVTIDGATAAVTGRDPAQAASGFTAQLQAAATPLRPGPRVQHRM